MNTKRMWLALFSVLIYAIAFVSPFVVFELTYKTLLADHMIEPKASLFALITMSLWFVMVLVWLKTVTEWIKERWRSANRVTESA